MTCRVPEPEGGDHGKGALKNCEYFVLLSECVWVL